MKTRKITASAILSAMALTIFVIEAQLPPIGIPGVKLGLSNVVTLVAMLFVSVPSALAVMLIRITLGAFFCGTVMSFAFSLCGGALAFIVMAFAKSRLDPHQIWVVSALGAVAHSLGQLAVAYFFIGNRAVFTLAPVLIICSVISGVLTGIITQRLWFSPLKKFKK